MSNMNNCLFYKITEKETTFIVLSNEESAYLKKYKHFIMVVNYVREQLEIGLIHVFKIKAQNSVLGIN